ncbi:MAG: hypothetical protein Greene041619_1006 [Candidatus Peregrinibacteria bacterium Greene0416_19]|nr:MAG: hypothetical protein Greene041619_1006 [Candidatus Peregrinibacteria bacterium Greene0416_19]
MTTEGGLPAIERFGNTEVWSAELGVPLKELQNCLGNPNADKQFGSTEIRRAVRDLLSMKQAEKQRTVEQIRTAAKSPLTLIILESSSRKGAFKLKSLGFRSWQELATYFGIEGNPWNSYLTRVRLAAAVFGTDHPDVAPRLEEVQELSKGREEPAGPAAERWISILKEKYPTGKDWLDARIPSTHREYTYSHTPPADEFGQASVENALRMFCTRFGFTRDALGDHEVRCAAGLKIYGEQDPFIPQYLAEKRERELARAQLQNDLAANPEAVRARVLEKVPPLERWYDKTPAERFQFEKEILFLGITVADLRRALCPQLETFGEMSVDAEELEGISLEVWLFGKQEIERWKTEKAKSDGETALQDKEQRKKTKRQLEVGKNRNALLSAVLNRMPYSYQWVNMHWKQRQAFRTKLGAQNIDLDAIALVFDIAVSPLASLQHHLLLGAKLYGQEDSVIRKAMQELEETGYISHVNMEKEEPSRKAQDESVPITSRRIPRGMI